MMNKGADIPLLLFAKAPIAGKVKTRLTTHCTPLQAAKIAEILIDRSLHAATEYWPGSVCLSVWQDQDHAFINSMLNKYGVNLISQKDGDLGEKMHGSFEEVGYPAAIMGCDAPLIPPKYFIQAYRYLELNKNVIGPSEDGGYYLIGLSAAKPDLFSNVSWGAEVVLKETLAIAREKAIELNQLPYCFDVDRWSDLMRASEAIASLKRYLVAQRLYDR